MKEKILQLLENDSRLTSAQLAVMCNTTAAEVENIVKECEEEGSIIAYKTLIDWSHCSSVEKVCALIELKTIPQRDKGFDSIAEYISNFPQVKSVYLMSGGYDLSLNVECNTMRDVALFVAEKLATIEGVTSTATHFVLQKYKDNGTIYTTDVKDERGNNW